jgi:Rrf2 family protein
MLAISKETTYALSFLLFLAKNKGSWPLEQISKQKKLPYKYLTRIVLELKKAGIVVVKTGRLGGYTLAKRATQISLKDILVLFERQKGVVACLVEGKKCKVKNCPQKPAWELLEKKVLKDAAKIRLKDLTK